MNAWRRELREMLDAAGAPRPPALRRSLREGWLYATDLPGIPGGERTADFLETAEKRGWKGKREAGWLLLKREAELPPEGWFSGPFGPEAACCRSLLERHGGGAGTAEKEVCLLVRAGEEGPEAYERACGDIHRAWAERLRKGQGLPGLQAAWFGAEEMKARESPE